MTQTTQSTGFKHPHSVTFVLPGDHRSGGVRVTVIMGNHLLAKGISCRIAYPKAKHTVRSLARRARDSLLGRSDQNEGWLHQFSGKSEAYNQLDELEFNANETVIAVGTYMVEDVRSLQASVRKVRFNHGMPTNPQPAHQGAWKGSMPTITVSQTLLPKLEQESGEKVLAVIPNGIDRTLYHPLDGIPRDGIGAVYNPHRNKDHRKLFEVLKLAKERWPLIPQYIFSTEAQPEELSHTVYTRYPSVEEATVIYNRAKAWLMTSKTEGLPGVALEAMSCGCVMVSSDNDGSLEIIRHNENGLIARQPNTEEYLSHIESVLNDEVQRERLSYGAITTAEAYTWEKAADKMVHFLNALSEKFPIRAKDEK